MAAAHQHPGTQHFLQEAKDLYEGKLQRAVTTCDTAEKWFTLRGELMQLAAVLGYFPNAEVELDNLDIVTFEDEPAPDNLNPLEE